MIEGLHELIAKTDAKVSALVASLDGSEILYAYRSHEKIVSASIIKVGIMLCALKEVEKGNLSLYQKILVKNEQILNDTMVFEDGEKRYSLLEIITWMIINSDNTATNVIIDILGLDKINAFFKDHKMQNTTLERHMLDASAIEKGLNNYSSQDDMYLIFDKLYHRHLLNDELTDIAIDILKRQRLKDQLLRYIFEPVVFGHKTGELDHLNHDVGVLELKGHRYYIGVFIYDTVDVKGDFKAIGKMGKIIYEYLKDHS